MAEMSETTATEVGPPPAPDPEKTVSPPYWPRSTTMFWLPATRARADSRGHERGPHGRVQPALVIPLRVRDLADGAPELPRVREVHRLDDGDRSRRNPLRLHVRPQRRRAEDRELRTRVVALHIVGGIGLGVPELLRLPQGVAERSRRHPPCS